MPGFWFFCKQEPEELEELFADLPLPADFALPELEPDPEPEEDMDTGDCSLASLACRVNVPPLTSSRMPPLMIRRVVVILVLTGCAGSRSGSGSGSPGRWRQQLCEKIP